MSIGIVATIEAKPEYLKDVEDVLRSLVAPSRQDEGNEYYSLNVDPNSPTTFVMVERWASEEALESHNQQPHFEQLLAIKEKLAALDVKVLNTLL